MKINVKFFNRINDQVSVYSYYTHASSIDDAIRNLYNLKIKPLGVLHIEEIIISIIINMIKERKAQ